MKAVRSLHFFVHPAHLCQGVHLCTCANVQHGSTVSRLRFRGCPLDRCFLLNPIVSQKTAGYGKALVVIFLVVYVVWITTALGTAMNSQNE